MGRRGTPREIPRVVDGVKDNPMSAYSLDCTDVKGDFNHINPFYLFPWPHYKGISCVLSCLLGPLERQTKTKEDAHNHRLFSEGGGGAIKWLRGGWTLFPLSPPRATNRQEFLFKVFRSNFVPSPSSHLHSPTYCSGPNAVISRNSYP